jgi:TolB protein
LFFSAQGRLVAAGREFRGVTPSPFAATVLSSAWTRDGQRLTYRGVDPDGVSTRLFVVSYPTGNPVPVGQNGTFAPAWSPDGTRISFRTGPSVGLMAADGSAVTVLPALRAADLAPAAWSPDGTHLVVAAASAVSGSVPQIVIVPVAGGLHRVLTSPTAAYGQGDVEPTWSPDGRHVAFSRCAESGECRITVVASDGTGLRAISSGGVDGRPAWSPDGRWIAFHRDTRSPTGYDIFIAPAAGGEIRTVSAAAGDDLNPSWRPSTPR